MSNRKTIKVSTNFFELKIYWNAKLVSTHIGILLGLFALRLFSTKDAVLKLCTVFIIIDLVSLLISLLVGSSIEEIDEDKNDEIPIKKDKMGTTIDSKNNNNPHKDTDTQKSSNGKKRGRPQSNVIKNKVPIPNANSNQGSSNTSLPVKTEDKIDVNKSSIAETPKDDLPKAKPVEEMTAEDWEELFKMD